jgi:hypothetical protein
MNTNVKLVVSFIHYEDDGWYGKRIRYYLAGPEDNGFTNKSEARKYASKLKKFIKKNLCKVITNNPIIGDINNQEEMPTYKYCGAGPSWSCVNYEVKMQDILSDIK